MTREVENFLRDTTNIKQALNQIFPPDVASHIMTLIVLDNLGRKSKKVISYDKNEKINTEGDEENNE